MFSILSLEFLGANDQAELKSERKVLVDMTGIYYHYY